MWCNDAPQGDVGPSLNYHISSRFMCVTYPIGPLECDMCHLDPSYVWVPGVCLPSQCSWWSDWDSRSLGFWDSVGFGMYYGRDTEWPKGQSHMVILRDFGDSKLWVVSYVDSKEAWSIESLHSWHRRKRVILVMGYNYEWYSTMEEGSWK